MIKFKKLIVLLIAVVCIAMLFACDAEHGETALPSGAPESKEEPSKQTIAAAYNDAVEKLLAARSYTMTGSVNSSSVMGEVLTSVVTSIDCRYTKDENGSAVILWEAEQRYDGNVLPHTTYFADGKYYISALDENYVVATNDFSDYDAAMIVKRVEDTVITNYTMDETEDGLQVRFEIPYGIYASEALDNLIGPIADDSLLQQPVTVRASIDKEGMLTSIYLDLENAASFGDERIEQAVILSLQMTAYNETEVKAPENLAGYEDRTLQESIEQNPEGEELPEDFTGDSLD